MTILNGLHCIIAVLTLPNNIEDKTYNYDVLTSNVLELCSIFIASSALFEEAKFTMAAPF